MKRKRGLTFLLPGLLLLPVLLLLSQPLQQTRTVRGKSPARPLTGQLTPDQALAQDLALGDPRVQAYTVGRRAEVFGVRDTMGHVPAGSAGCRAADCYQVEIYIFDENAAVTAVVNVDEAAVLQVLYQPGVHPGINKRLADRAREIVTNHPDVIEALGFRPHNADLAAVDASLLDSNCNGDHLCVAPVIVLEDRVLWTFVDLTEDRLVELRWTDAGLSGSSERFIPTGCPAGGQLNQLGWSLHYQTTSSDGLRIYDASFNGVPVLTSAKLIEWHADYGDYGFQDSTGCGGGGGGYPIYPYGETVIQEINGPEGVIGFELIQDFRMGNWGQSCNYRYGQRVQFFNDGRFRITGGAYGQGCDPTTLYRPILRLDLAIAGMAEDQYARWDGQAYVVQETEDYWVPYDENGHGPHQYSPEGYIGRISDGTGLGYYLEPGQGQFDDGGRGDDPFIYLTRHHPEEGDTDMGVLGNCCLDNHQQGPHTYLDGESVNGANLVLWYVPQMQTVADGEDYYCWTVSGEPDPETYPCFGGPMFVPVSPIPPLGSKAYFPMAGHPSAGDGE